MTKKKLSIISESLPANADPTTTVAYFDDLKPPENAFVDNLTRKEGESVFDFDLRRMVDVLINFYEIDANRVSSPFSVDGRLIQGISITSSEVLLVLDYPALLLEAIPTGHRGCRMSLFIPANIAADPSIELTTFFQELPSSLGYAPWGKSTASTAEMNIFESLLVAQSNLHYHFAVDSLARVLDWLKESHGC